MYLFCVNINLRGGIMINFIKKVLRRLLIIFLNIVLLICMMFVMSKGREFRKIIKICFRSNRYKCFRWETFGIL